MATQTSKKRFHVRFEEAKEGGYIVSIPEMPGCVTQAETFEEGLAMVQDALEGLLQVAREYGDPIPEQFRDVLLDVTPRRAARRAKQVVVSGRQASRAPSR
jgi:predicted RNase H-like HicB family nuclease